MSLNSIDKRAQISAEARSILERFSKALEEVKVSEGKVKGELGGFREEGAGVEGEGDFRGRMFANAPKSEGDFIIAEKKSW